MTHPACTTTGEELLAWWLGEINRAEDERLDEPRRWCERNHGQLT